jgi:peptide/nickel transport system permease protein
MKSDLRRKQVRAFLRNRTSIVGAVLTALILLIAIFANSLIPYNPLEQNVYHRLKPPEKGHICGTDFFGRDVISRIVWGSRTSLAVGIGSVTLGMLAGCFMGMLSAYEGGKIGSLIMRFVDVMMCFPSEIFAILVLVVLGEGLVNLILSIAVVMTPRFARLSYGSTLSLKNREYVEASRALGAKSSRVILITILPNMLGEILVMFSLWIAVAIRVEANLSFLGLGIPPPTPTWGNMVREGVWELTNAPWLSVFPGLAIMVAVLAFNLVGDGLRDLTDPKLQD